MNYGPLVREILVSVISSAFDPPPVGFRQADEAGVRPVRLACQRTSDAIYSLKKPLNRNAFLWGCLDFTEGEPIEHLIIGFGYKRGSTIKISGVAHVAGSSSSVSVPEPVQQAIDMHVASAYSAEVSIFHNHPTNPLNILFDNTPLASSRE